VANSPTNVTFVDYVTPVTATWLNFVNTFVNTSSTAPANVITYGADPTGTLDSTAAFNTAAATGVTIYVPDGTYKILGTVTTGTAAWNVSPRAQFTGSFPYLNRGFWTNISGVSPFGNGANIWKFNDRVFVGTATKTNGVNNHEAADWINTSFPVFGGPTGAYEYLLNNATVAVGAPFGQCGITSYARTSDRGAGGGGSIAMGSVVVNDNSIGSGYDSWTFYGTSVRTAAATGTNTTGIEIDVANLGSTVPIYPNQMFNTGQTVGIGVCAGGELQNDSSVSLGISSAAYTIASNDITGLAKWEKGIVFHSQGLKTTGGLGLAINMGIGHSIAWWDNSNFLMNQIYSTCTTGATGNCQSINFSNNGFLITDSGGNPQFRILNGISTTANYIQITSTVTGGTPVLGVDGTDTNINLNISAQGTGQIVLGSNINQLKIASGVYSTASAGAASALPALPAGYLEMTVNGTLVKVPYYGL
jgi:hypothetical protein